MKQELIMEKLSNLRLVTMGFITVSLLERDYYMEYQSVCPFVCIGSPPPPQVTVAPPLRSGGGGHTRLRGRVWEDPIKTTGQTLWCSV